MHNPSFFIQNSSFFIQNPSCFLQNSSFFQSSSCFTHQQCARVITDFLVLKCQAKLEPAASRVQPLLVTGDISKIEIFQKEIRIPDQQVRILDQRIPLTTHLGTRTSCSSSPAPKHCHFSTEFIIFNTEFIIFSTKRVTFSTQFIIFDARFIINNAKDHHL